MTRPDRLARGQNTGDIDYGSITKLAQDAPLDNPSSVPAESGSKYHAIVTSFRNDIHYLASQSAPTKDILGLCDAFRDVQLSSFDIYIEDRENSPALVRPLDSALRKALAEKQGTAIILEKEKTGRKLEEAERKLAPDKKESINLREMSRNELYSQWDEQVIQTRDTKGEEVTKGVRKKLVKLHEKQKLYTKRLNRHGGHVR